MIRAVAGALLAAAAALACAQPGRPPGGEVDRSPPRVVETRPAAFDTLTDLSQPVVILFDERLSIRLEGVTELREAVLISPTRGVPIVDRGGRRVTIRAAGGWEPDRVYRVVIQPVFRDLFGNQRQEPVELVFSTGAPIPDAALAGFVRDRLTGRPAADAWVRATRRIDDQQYVAVTDTGGFFAMRFAPAGAYDLTTWTDQDRDREPDFFEAQDTADAVLAVNDTVVVELAVLPMDTTPARLARVEAIDSARLRLVFDDYFAPGPVVGETRLFLLPDTTPVPTEGRLIHETRLDSILEAEAAARAARDSARTAAARRDTAEAIVDSLEALPDSLRPSQDSVRVLLRGLIPATTDTAAAPDTAQQRALRPDERARRPGQARPGERPETQQPGTGRPAAGDEPLPGRELVLILAEPLIPDTTYYLEVEGVVNIRGVEGGGGADAFRSAAPDTAAVDSAAVDSTAAGPAGDSAGAPPDTVPAPVRDLIPSAGGR